MTPGILETCGNAASQRQIGLGSSHLRTDGIGVQGLITLESVATAAITRFAHHTSCLDGIRISAIRQLIN